MRQQDLTPARRRQLVACPPPHANCKALVPPPTPRSLPPTPGVATALREASEALARLSTAATHLSNTDLITRTLTRREAVQSSQIEGTRTQLSELLAYEATRTLAGATADAKVTERYVIALDQGLRAQRHEMKGPTLALIKSVHKTLMSEAHERLRPGEWRDTQAWIGSGRIEDAIFVPPPPDAVDRCMRELETSMLRYEAREDEQWELPIAARLVIAHAQFETIHPFADGNGRVGRLLMPLMLEDAGYPPLYLSGYLLRHRQVYYAALAGVQLREEWDVWTAFLCRAIVEACDTSIDIANDLNAIAARWEHMLDDLRADAAAKKVTRLLLGHPVITINELAMLLGSSFQTASTAVDVLVARGILHAPPASVKRGRIFYAREMLDRLDRQ